MDEMEHEEPKSGDGKVRIDLTGPFEKNVEMLKVLFANLHEEKRWVAQEGTFLIDSLRDVLGMFSPVHVETQESVLVAQGGSLDRGQDAGVFPQCETKRKGLNLDEGMSGAELPISGSRLVSESGLSVRSCNARE
jgi:hypothetical protein